jgi:hypothetical protein
MQAMMNMESLTRPVFLSVILGTARQGRLSEAPARFVVEQLSQRPEVETELINIRNSRRENLRWPNES